jgi:putative oxidoreductase
MLKPLLSPFADRIYAALRIISGLMFAFHGMQKIFGVLAQHPQPKVGSQGWIGGLIELGAGVLIALGLFTRCAAFVASGTMAVAYFQFHMTFGSASGMIPVSNGGELAVLYCWLFLFIAAKGAGEWSVDAKREKAKAGS